jgi:hypothetical protein
MHFNIELLLNKTLLKNKKYIFKISFKRCLKSYYLFLEISRWSNIRVTLHFY